MHHNIIAILLSDSFIEVDAKTRKEWIVLYLIIWNNNIWIVNLLLYFDVNVFNIDNHDQILMHWDVKQIEDEKIIEILANANCDVFIFDKQ